MVIYEHFKAFVTCALIGRILEKSVQFGRFDQWRSSLVSQALAAFGCCSIVSRKWRRSIYWLVLSVTCDRIVGSMTILFWDGSSQVSEQNFISVRAFRCSITHHNMLISYNFVVFRLFTPTIYNGTCINYYTQT